MALDSRDAFLSCPICPFETPEFSRLESHVRNVHAEGRAEESEEQPPALPPRPSQPNQTQLSDEELAQVLAFEEAGLPAELALSDRCNVTSSSPGRPQIAGAARSNTSSPDPPADRATSPSASPSRSNDTTSPWAECFCGERVHFTNLGAHSDMHAQETISLTEADVLPDDGETEQQSKASSASSLKDLSSSFSTAISRSLRNYNQMMPRSSSPGDKRKGSSLKEIFLGSPTAPKRKSSYKAVVSKAGRHQQLGRSELGPYAHEKQMPFWLRTMLEEGPKVTTTNRIGPDGTVVKVEHIANQTPNLVHVLARLSQLDPTVHRAIYCSPEVHQVAKMEREGGFCGYRNIQMLISYLQGAKAHGVEHFPGRLPSILKLQDMIENAWDMGFNEAGRTETGGIKNTRKYIGTPEAQALFLSLGIPCEATAYTTTSDVIATDTMLCAVLDHFEDETTRAALDNKVIITNKAPIYLQHQGHSMTIVGVETRTDGSTNLVVFDPMYNPSPALKKLAEAKTTSFRTNDPQKLIKAHRRGEKYLDQYRDFELLRLK